MSPARLPWRVPFDVTVVGDYFSTSIVLWLAHLRRGRVYKGDRLRKQSGRERKIAL